MMLGVFHCKVLKNISSDLEMFAALPFKNYSI